jgi:hypothetical protein
MNTPVVFIIFNRPGLTRQVFAAIRAAQPRLLMVVADGPRSDRPGEAERCAEVRALVEAGVDWPCEVRRNYAETNLGCARRVVSGLDWVFGQVEQAIILEDDCLPAPEFFSFCCELLARYADHPLVGQVSGCCFVPRLTGDAVGPDYYFSRYPHCWGWATWAAKWRKYDNESCSQLGEAEIPWPEGLIHRRERRAWRKRFEQVGSASMSIWDYRWTMSCWQHGMLSANAYVNLVSNIGFGTDATHTHSGDLGEIPLGLLSFPLRHPTSIAADHVRDELVSRRVFRPPLLWLRLLARIRRIFT